MRKSTPKELRDSYPKLVDGCWKPKSLASPRYNCVAFAAGSDRHWWEPGMNGGRYHWPSYARQRDTLQAWIEVFVGLGYEQTTNRDPDPDYEKVAIYVDIGLTPQHVAASDGAGWKSKLGKDQDIWHATLDVLEGDQGDEYGIVDCVLRRPKTGV